MAYMSQDNKKSKEPLIKALLKKHGVKGSVSVNNSSTLVVTIKSGRIDFIGNYNATGDGTRSAPEGYIQVNPHWCHEHFTGEAKDCLVELLKVMNSGNHDKSEPQIDHFDVGWYVDINIGKWDKPYVKED